MCLEARQEGEAGHIIFAPELLSCIEGVRWAPSCGYWSLGRRVVAIGHWEGGLSRKITGSVVQSSCAKGVRRVISFLHQNPPHVYYSISGL